MWEWVKHLLGLDGLPDGKYYVYELLDPRFEGGRVFYVGKGTEDRVYQHQKDAERYLRQGRYMLLKPKHKRILELLRDGYQVDYRIIFRTDDEIEAYRVESARIDYYGLYALTNETYGYKPRALKRASAARVDVVRLTQVDTPTRARKSRLA